MTSSPPPVAKPFAEKVSQFLSLSVRPWLAKTATLQRSHLLLLLAASGFGGIYIGSNFGGEERAAPSEQVRGMADQRAAPAEGSRGSTNQPVAVVSRLRGRATTEAGQPLAGVNVRANSTIFAYSALTAETDDDGWYTIEMPNAPNSYVAAATITKEYNGRTYTLDLAPSSQSSFGPTADVTRNFTMKMTGAINKELNHYWGWPVGVVEAGYNYEYDVSQVELTLVPVGPLIDGSVGKTIVARPADKHGYVRDVPIGQYRISARYMPTGKPLKLRLYREQDGAASSSVVANFDPNAKRILVEFDPK